MNKIIITLMLAIFFISLVSGANPFWVNDENNCPAVNESQFSGQDCSPDNICGDESGTAQCFDTSTLTPPGSNATSNTNVASEFDGGFLINCFADADDAEPFCDNDEAFNCDRNSSCFTTQSRDTTCLTSAFGRSICSDCRSGFNDCDTDTNPCEIQNGASCSGSTGTYNACLTVGSGGAGNCTSSTNSDCDNDDSDGNLVTCNFFGNGCEIISGATCGNSTGGYVSSQCLGATGNCTRVSENIDCNDDDSDANLITCNGLVDGCEVSNNSACSVGDLGGTILGCSAGLGNCVIDAQHHLTNMSAKGSSASAITWSEQWNANGYLVNFTNMVTNRSVLFNASACIIFPDGTAQCSASVGGGTSNPFDQILNTTSNVTFHNATITSDLVVTGNFFANIIGSITDFITIIYATTINVITGNVQHINSTEGNFSKEVNIDGNPVSIWLYNQSDGSFNATYDSFAYNETQGYTGDSYLINGTGATPITYTFNETLQNETIQDKSLNETEANTTYLKLTGNNANQKIRIEPFTISVPTPLAPNDSANKEYVDDAVAGINFDFFLNDGPSDITGYFNMTEEDLDVAETTLTTSSLPVGVTTIFNFTTLDGQPEFKTLIGGVYDAHIHFDKSGPGTRNVKIFWELYNRTGSIENLLLTGEHSDFLTQIETEYDMHGFLDGERMMNSGDRLILKLIANVTGGGSNPTVTITMQGTSDSHFTVQTTTGAFEAIFLRQDGSKELSGNWTTGAFDILGSKFYGLFNWTTLTEWLVFDGATLNFNQVLLNETIALEGVAIGFNSTFNQTYEGSVNNASYLSTFNLSYDGSLNNASYLSTFNQTYEDFSYNETNIINLEFQNSFNLNISDWETRVNASYLSTFNATYDIFAYNQTIAIAGLSNIFDQDLNTTSNVKFANLTIAGNGSFGGNVGIGTASPNAPFEIHFTDSGTSTLDGDSIFLRNLDTTDGSANRIRFTNSIGSLFGSIGFVSTDESTGKGDFRIMTRNTGGANNFGEAFIVQDDGQVGIGTATPDVSGFGTTTLTIETDGTNKRALLELMSPNLTAGNAAGVIAFGNKNASSTAVGRARIQGIRDGANDAMALQFLTEEVGAAVNVKMTILGSGNVGIGTASPLGDLDIKQSGGTFADGFHLVSSVALDTWSFVVGGGPALFIGFAPHASGADEAGDFSGQMTLNADLSVDFASDVEVTGEVSIPDYNFAGGKVPFKTFNTNAGSSVNTAIRVGNADGESTSVGLVSFGTGFTTSGALIQDGAMLQSGSGLAGGLNLVAQHTSGDVRIYAGGRASGDLSTTFLDNGSVGIGTTTPSSKLDVFGLESTITISDNQQSGVWGNKTLGNIDWYTSDASASGPRTIGRLRLRGEDFSAFQLQPGAEFSFHTGNSFVDIDDVDPIVVINRWGMSVGLNYKPASPISGIIVNGSVGIGTKSTASILHVYQDNALTGANIGLTLENDGAGDVIAQFLTTGDTRWVIGNDNTDDAFKFSPSTDLHVGTVVTFAKTGEVGIGTSTPTHTLNVDGTANFTNKVTIGNVVPASGSVTLSSGNVTIDGGVRRLEDSSAFCLENPTSGGITDGCTSDRGLKTDIINLTDNYFRDKYSNITMFEFQMNGSIRREVGFIAQELNKTNPEKVITHIIPTFEADGNLINVTSNVEVFNNVSNKTEMILFDESYINQTLIQTGYKEDILVENFNTGELFGMIKEIWDWIFGIEERVEELETENQRIKDCTDSSKDFAEYKTCVNPPEL